MYSSLNKSVTLNCKENLILFEVLVPLLWTKNCEKIIASPSFTFVLISSNCFEFLINLEFFFLFKYFFLCMGFGTNFQTAFLYSSIH